MRRREVAAIEDAQVQGYDDMRRHRPVLLPYYRPGCCVLLWLLPRCPLQVRKYELPVPRPGRSWGTFDGDNQLVARNGELEEQHEHPTWQT